MDETKRCFSWFLSHSSKNFLSIRKQRMPACPTCVAHMASISRGWLRPTSIGPQRQVPDLIKPSGGVSDSSSPRLEPGGAKHDGKWRFLRDTWAVVLNFFKASPPFEVLQVFRGSLDSFVDPRLGNSAQEHCAILMSIDAWQWFSGGGCKTFLGSKLLMFIWHGPERLGRRAFLESGNQITYPTD